MDHQKDNRFRPGEGYSQGQYRNNNKGHSQTPEAQQVSVEQKKRYPNDMSFIVRKTEKLTTALYMVTDIMSDREPMKWKVRETGVDLLSDITVSSTLSTSEHALVVDSSMRKIERIISFLDIAQSTRMLSEMNSSVLRREYAALKDALEAESTRAYEQSKSIFSESFFDVPVEATKLLGGTHDHADEKSIEERPYKGHQDLEKKSPALEVAQGQSLASVARQETPKPLMQVPLTPRINFPGNQSHNSDLRTALQALTPKQESFKSDSLETSTTKEVTPRVTPLPPIAPRVAGEHTMTPPTQSRQAVSESGVIERARPDASRDDRRKIILALIKQKPSLTVKDIARSIPGVSEKTIQRELLAMVAEGILIKRGERRWSTYALREGIENRG